jgi:serine/threonine protein kinase
MFGDMREIAAGVAVRYVTINGERKLVAAKRGQEHSAILLDNEAKFYNKLYGCPNVVQFYGVQDGCLLLELMDTNLEIFMAKYPNVSLETVNLIAQQVLEGICQLGERKVVHNDLQLRNILVSYDNNKEPKSLRVKLCDFGLACSEGETLPGIPHFNFVTPESVNAPSGRVGLTEKSNVFLFGLVLFYLYSSCPHPVLPSKLTIEAENLDFLCLNYSIPYHIAVLISKCLKINPEHRPTSTELRSLFGAHMKHQSTRIWNNTPARVPVPSAGYVQI